MRFGGSKAAEVLVWRGWCERGALLKASNSFDMEDIISWKGKMSLRTDILGVECKRYAHTCGLSHSWQLEGQHKHDLQILFEFNVLTKFRRSQSELCGLRCCSLKRCLLSPEIVSSILTSSQLLIWGTS